MNTLNRIVVACAVVSAFACSANAADGTATFAKMKTLVGTWKGTMGSAPTTIRFRVISGGNVIEESMDASTAHEMVTMYVLNGGTLQLTHYCAMGNQPLMKMQPGADSNVASFEFAGGSNIKPGGMHMHSMRLTFAGPDHIQEDWGMFSGDKVVMHGKIDLHRATEAK